jgi:membrane associated rhomboid family serine protease
VSADDDGRDASAEGARSEAKPSEGGPPQERIALRGARQGIVLGAEGFHHPRSARGRGRAYTRYVDLTHVAFSDRAVWLAARRALTVISRDTFAEPGGPVQLRRLLLERVAALPGGGARIARMAELDALGRHLPRLRATWGLTLLCGVGFALQGLLEPEVILVGSFSPRLFADGDLWRIVTANLLHGFPLHLLMNLFGLLVLGRLVERALGGARTLCVMGASALGAMAVSGWYQPGDVVGVSGVVLGLAAALVWLELRWRAELPAWWRFPGPLRRFLVLALAADLGLGFFVPVVAAEAHLGGFVAGLLATALATRGGPTTQALLAVRGLARAVLAATVLAVGAAGLQLGLGDYTARHASRLVQLPDVPPEDLNNVAWSIAVDPGASAAQLQAALELAERAVAQTEGREASLLDTLADHRSGHRPGASGALLPRAAPPLHRRAPGLRSPAGPGPPDPPPP